MEHPIAATAMSSVPSSPFDFSGQMRLLCQDAVDRLPELGHVDLSRLAIGFAQTRQRSPSGVLATLTPLRFAAGSRYTVRRGRVWTIPPVHDTTGRELLYLLRFFLPRFLDLPLSEKLVTVVHELWHVSPECDGDLRRHKGRCHAHGSSRRRYDDQMRTFVDRWWQAGLPGELTDCWQRNFRQIDHTHGSIIGLRIRQPRLVAASAAAARQCLRGE